MATPRETPPPSQGARFGAISGFLLKLLREGARFTQAEFAERLGVDISTIGSWESGRRPLANLRAGDLTRIRMLLTRHGAPSNAIALFDDALQADLIIGDTVGSEPDTISVDDHPLSVSIHQRTLANFITWPINGRPPVQLDALAGERGRGPRPSSPVISADDRQRFFDHLLVVADRCRGPADALLRRQAIYLLGFDDRSDSAEWLAGELTRALHSVAHTDVPGWLWVRSSAIALAATGDREPLRARMLPYAAGMHGGMAAGNSFLLLDFPDDPSGEPIEPPLAYVDTLTGAMYLNKPSEFAAYELVWRDIDKKALSATKSKELIISALEGLEQ